MATKTVKRLEVLGRETRRSQRGRPQGGAANNNKIFCVGLSFGPSSAALVDICEQIIVGQRSKGRDAAFTLRVVHVDVDLEQQTGSSGSSPVTGKPVSSAEQRLDRWRSRYPVFSFELVPLTDVFALDTIDWAALWPQAAGTSAGKSQPQQPHPRPSTAADLRALLASLPSASSRRDILDQLVRRLLVSQATTGTGGGGPADALLLGCSTTALAEKTLAETAKGRGFSLPWQINDGTVETGGDSVPQLPLYYPLRELFRNELALYTQVAQPPLTEGDLILALPSTPSAPSSAVPTAAIVSHKDLSIEDVMTRFFAEVEANYPSIVANVVRTTAKLERHGHDHAQSDQEEQDSAHSATSCSICGMPLDEAGDERWNGEIGLEELGKTLGAQLCYGCQRSIHG